MWQTIAPIIVRKKKQSIFHKERWEKKEKKGFGV
jgi:hypothetical protein